MTLRVLLQIEIQPEATERFERLWHDHAAHVATLADNHGQTLLRRTDRDDAYVVLTDWTDEPAFRAFERSERQQAYLKELWAIRAGGSMTLLDVVTDLVPAAG
ncbi:antibiotic biosynthesis monooxygenase family protein [Actinoplanes sp. NPDC049316]|uniref:antibiotic biosynthesis monooxygenase family protein n=1 Tax=Actinoplanes sp. NPDC049316 TaxID=3154727 RepID=UPI0034454A33